VHYEEIVFAVCVMECV